MLEKGLENEVTKFRIGEEPAVQNNRRQQLENLAKNIFEENE